MAEAPVAEGRKPGLAGDRVEQMAEIRNCPGADNVKIPELELVECPKCGGEAEFFTRDKKSICTECGETVYREQRPSCIDWCPMADKCFPDLVK